jgi:hypothetical protein
MPVMNYVTPEPALTTFYHRVLEPGCNSGFIPQQEGGLFAGSKKSGAAMFFGRSATILAFARLIPRCMEVSGPNVFTCTLRHRASGCHSSFSL